MSRKPIRSPRHPPRPDCRGRVPCGWLASAPWRSTRRQGDSAFRRLSQRSLALRQGGRAAFARDAHLRAGELQAAPMPLQQAVDARRVSLGRRIELNLAGADPTGRAVQRRGRGTPAVASAA